MRKVPRLRKIRKCAARHHGERADDVLSGSRGRLGDAAGENEAYSYVLSRANIVEYPIKFKFRFVVTEGLLNRRI